jgi:hypothetical protein
MSELSKFHTLAHIFIALIGAILLLTIWHNIKKHYQQLLEEDNSSKRVDKGLLYLSGAVFVWVVSGYWEYLAYQLDFETDLMNLLGVGFLSILNNLFLLLALFYFDHAPSFIYKHQKNTKKIIFLIISTALLTLVLSLISNNTEHGVFNIIGIPDLILSTFLCYLMIISFYKTFYHRGLPVVAIISVLVIVLMFSSQLPEVFLTLNNGFGNTLMKLIAKTSLISVFLVLATTWVIQLATTPKPSEMAINFLDWSLIKITIPSKGIYEQRIDFGSKTTQYKNLFKFAIRRKEEEGEKQCLLVSAGGEIKSQTYLSRIIENINTILALDSTQKLARKDLFTFIGEGKYRLRMLPQNITIDAALLNEFKKQ